MPANTDGRIIVSMDVVAYKQKALELFKCNETYERLLIKHLDSWHESTRIKVKQLSQLCADKSLFNSFTTTNPSLSYFYGLPKICKPQCPLRQITANIGIVTRALAGWLAQQLSTYLNSFYQSDIKNLQDFKWRQIIFDAENSTNLVKGVSLYIVSLFYKVPVDDFLGFVDRKNQQGDIVAPMLGVVFISLLKICIDGNLVIIYPIYGAMYWVLLDHQHTKIGPALSGVLGDFHCIVS